MESANKMKNQIDDSFQIMTQFSHGVRPFARGNHWKEKGNSRKISSS